MNDHYRVIVDRGGCKHCHEGRLWTIVSGAGDDEIAIGSSFGEEEHTQDICDLMNMAYATGIEASDVATEATAEVDKLIEFFNNEGESIGRDGDYNNLSPAETAIQAMRKLLK